jgi:c-di-GMP-binding flagellar brake protein YcgR
MPLDSRMEQHLGISQPMAGRSSTVFIEARRAPRFKLEVDIRVYARNRAVVRGHTVDISESGVAAMLLEEITLDEVVRLEFTLPAGEVEVLALVRQRVAFRYGFEFIESGPAHTVISHTCRDFAIEQSLSRLSPH